MKVIIQNRRATLFITNIIEFSVDNLPEFISAFNSMGLLPSVNKGIGIKITPSGVEPEDVISLDLKYLDDSLKVSFGPNRVDIVSTKTSETWEMFLDIVKNISQTICKIVETSYARLALCASIRYLMENEEVEKVYSKVIKPSDERPVEWQFKRVLRIPLESPEKDTHIVINKVFNIARNQAVVNGEDISNLIILDADINTVQGTNSKDIEKMKDVFWKSSSEIIEQVKESYATLLK